ncbi:hypothetical protein [Palleronia caenipelagi]|uniref:Uncharacterized protein n=1 Tax=Palleronia caenipelagi TaxID=2489174 RepID=A0A547PS37_9RHOB|nr:hypothetical protein [Palleronia caenipelagi]TRD16962.1 hypothetical protein FEV53_13580 [Palleronia caenipelagi]
MSLMMMALRITAVEALKAAGTLVGDNVLDSQIAAIDHTSDGQLSSDQKRPFIAVYTDMAKATDLGATGLRTNGQVDLTFNCGVSMTMATTDRETGETEIIEGLPATDAHLEAILDVLEVQIGRALTDPDNPWAQVFGDFVQSYVARQAVRASSSADNVRLAAGQIKLTLEVFADPRLGQPMDPEGPWARFMALMRDHDLPQRALFETLLGAPTTGLYEPIEQLTSMTVRDAEALQLYSYGGVARDVTITEATSDAEPG